jgi:hypothetical protein
MWFPAAVTFMVMIPVMGAWAQDSSGSKAAQNSVQPPQIAQPADGGVNWKGVGAGAGAVVSNLVYVPAKLVYGILGGFAGGAGYALTGGNKQVADSIWRSSLGGDYVLTPDMMTGKAPIYFSGPSEPETAPGAAGTASTSAGVAASSSSVPMSIPTAGTVTSTGPHPIDTGAGAMTGTSSPRPVPYAGADNPGSSGYHSSHSSPPAKASTLQDSSIE